MTSERQQLIERIHRSERQLVLAITGGGSGAIAALLEVPGASATVLEAIVPYASKALEEWLGGSVDQYCSERTARAMAMAAFERARQLSPEKPDRLRGIGVTASLASNRPKRGSHRIHAAWQSAETTVVVTRELEKDLRTRSEEEQVASELVLQLIAEACAANDGSIQNIDSSTCKRIQHARSAWTELLLGQRTALRIENGHELESHHTPPTILFPGAFDPIHRGHLRMAQVAAARLGAPVTFELSIANVDKPSLDFIEIANRIAQFGEHDLLLTAAPTFLEKAAIAPGCVFIVGGDTIERIGQPRYYGGDVARRDVALATLAKSGCHFLVFGRKSDSRFLTLADVDVPAALRSLCEQVPQSEFQEDVSSTELRSR